MFRHILLALTFVAALGAAGLGVANEAEARRGCGGGGSYYGGHRASYYSPYSYHSYHGSRYQLYYGGHRGHHGHHGHRSHHGHHGFSFSFGH